MFYYKMIRYNTSQKHLVVYTVKRFVCEAVNPCELPYGDSLSFDSKWEVFRVLAIIGSSVFLHFN